MFSKAKVTRSAFQLEEPNVPDGPLHILILARRVVLQCLAVCLQIFQKDSVRKSFKLWNLEKIQK